MTKKNLWTKHIKMYEKVHFLLQTVIKILYIDYDFMGVYNVIRVVFYNMFAKGEIWNIQNQSFY